MNFWHQWHMGCTLKRRWFWISKPFQVAPWWHINHMTNHWSCQPRQSTNQILLLWLIWRICNHFIKPCRSGRSLFFAQIPVPCHQLCMELPSFVLPLSINNQHAVTCKYHVCTKHVSSHTHIMALNSCHLFQRNLTFPRCGEEWTTCSITSIIGPKKDHPKTQVFVRFLTTRNTWTCW